MLLTLKPAASSVFRKRDRTTIFFSLFPTCTVANTMKLTFYHHCIRPMREQQFGAFTLKSAKKKKRFQYKCIFSFQAKLKTNCSQLVCQKVNEERINKEKT